MWILKKPDKMLDVICTMAILDSLILAHCPKTHFKLNHRVGHTLPLIHQTGTQFILSLLSSHMLNWDQLHTQDTGAYVIPKSLMRHFLSAKIPGVQRVGCQFGDSHFATLPLSSQK